MGSGEPDLDALGLLAHRAAASVTFGDVDAIAARNLVAETALDQMPEARFSIDLRFMPAVPLDYQSVVSVAIGLPGQRRPAFSGSVLRASPSSNAIDVEAATHPMMSEALIGDYSVTRLPVQEHFDVLSRGAGLPEPWINIEGLEDLPLEVFEVVVPVRGVTVAEPLRVGDVTLVPVSVGIHALAGAGVPEDLAERFRQADCHAVAWCTANRTLDAEENGLRQIDTVLGWILARARYGLAWLPDRRPQAYERGSRRAQPRRSDLVAVRGLATRRHWLRTVEPISAQATLDFGSDRLLLFPRLTGAVSTQQRQALAALRRMAASNDTATAVSAFWEAIEFYVGEASFPDVYTRAERKALSQAIPEGISDDVRRRARNALDRLNQRPLMERLRLVADEDRVPVSEGEWRLLGELRKARNAGVHGGAERTVYPDQLELAASILARLLVFRVASRSSNLRQ